MHKVATCISILFSVLCILSFVFQWNFPTTGMLFLGISVLFSSIERLLPERQK